MVVVFEARDKYTAECLSTELQASVNEHLYSCIAGEGSPEGSETSEAWSIDTNFEIEHARKGEAPTEAMRDFVKDWLADNAEENR